MTRKEFFKLIQNELLHPVDEREFTGNLRFRLEEKDSDDLYDTYTKSNHEIFERTGLSKESYLKKQFLESKALKKFFAQYKLKPDISIIQSFPIKVEFNPYFEEDGFLFNGEINGNEIYDRLNLNLGKTKLYRLECSDGKGAYSGNIKIHSECEHRNPAPESDGDIRTIFSPRRVFHAANYYKNWIFAFESKESLFNWFHNEKDAQNFLEKDIVITEYETENQFIVKGKTQVAFMRSKATKQDSIPYSDIAKEHQKYLQKNNVITLLIQREKAQTPNNKPRRKY